MLKLKPKENKNNSERRNVQTFSSLFHVTVTSGLILVFPLLFLLRCMLVCACRNYCALLVISAFFMFWPFIPIL